MVIFFVVVIVVGVVWWASSQSNHIYQDITYEFDEFVPGAQADTQQFMTDDWDYGETIPLEVVDSAADSLPIQDCAYPMFEA